MDKRSVVLTSEEWERLIEILDLPFVQHPDKEFLLTRIHNQLVYTSSDTPKPLPSSPTFSHSIPTTGEIIKEIIDNKQILADGIKAYDQS